jgi:hypothetical protein
MSCRAELRNPCRTVACVKTSATGVRHKARPVFELITQITGDMSCQKTVKPKPKLVVVNHCQVLLRVQVKQA